MDVPVDGREVGKTRIVRHQSVPGRHANDGRARHSPFAVAETCQKKEERNATFDENVNGAAPEPLSRDRTAGVRLWHRPEGTYLDAGSQYSTAVNERNRQYFL